MSFVSPYVDVQNAVGEPDIACGECTHQMYTTRGSAGSTGASSNTSVSDGVSPRVASSTLAVYLQLLRQPVFARREVGR